MLIKSTSEKSELSTLTCLSLQDWAKPGPYDQPMVNTLRRKKDKETPAVDHSNGSVSNDSGPPSISTSVPAPAALPTSASVEEKNRTVAAPLKVSFSSHVILFVFPQQLLQISKYIIWLITLVLM